MLRTKVACRSGTAAIAGAFIYDTDTGDALVQGYVDQAASAALNVPNGESVVRIPVHLVPRLLYGLSSGTFSGEVPA